MAMIRNNTKKSVHHIIKQKHDFTLQLQDKLLKSGRIENVKMLELLSRDYLELMPTIFQTRNQERGLRLTPAGFNLAIHAGLPNCEYNLKISNLENYTILLADCSRYLPAPYYVRSFYPFEICVFGAECCTAITMVGGFMDFLNARKDR